MEFNFLIIAIAAIVPLLVGFLWYSPNVFGDRWMKECNFTLETIGKPNPVIYLYCYFLSFLLTFILSTIVIHQFAFYSILMNEPSLTEVGSDLNNYVTDFMVTYGNNFRTFKHGALHGTMVGLLIVLPVLGTNALFEKRSFKYVMINSGYWMISLALVGGILCQFT